jgi:hypothetical protein
VRARISPGFHHVWGEIRRGPPPVQCGSRRAVWCRPGNPARVGWLIPGPRGNQSACCRCPHQSERKRRLRGRHGLSGPPGGVAGDDRSSRWLEQHGSGGRAALPECAVDQLVSCAVTTVNQDALRAMALARFREIRAPEAAWGPLPAANPRSRPLWRSGSPITPAAMAVTMYALRSNRLVGRSFRCPSSASASRLARATASPCLCTNP